MSKNVKNLKKTNYIFVTGGVVSSLGKGLTGAALAAVLQARGFSVVMQKLDPYLNVDPGTMSPLQHGEVFVTEDGAETDLDLGHYERFTGNACTKDSNYTTGRIYMDILTKERRGDYLGATVQVVPHVTGAICDAIRTNEGVADFAIVEIGGTVGDIESPAFYESIRQYAYEVGRDRCLFMHLTLVPYLKTAGEVKTKPTQHSVRELLKLGIQADVLVCRSDRDIPENELKKIAMFCNVPENHVIACKDSDSIYRVPLNLHQAGLDAAVMDHFNLGSPLPNLSDWDQCANTYLQPKGQVSIAVVGKYTSLGDAYKSLNEALIHGGIAENVRVNIKFVDSEALEGYSADELKETFADVQGILVPGGFGNRGTEGKIRAIQFARENKVPYFGICLGMQMAVVEFARNVAGLKDAASSEFGAVENPVIGLMTEWQTEEGSAKRSQKSDLGGTMRLGAYPCLLAQGTKAYDIYGQSQISERHRHRYEFNNGYKEKLEQAGLVFSGTCPEGNLCEVVEIPTHPWFVAAQFHPEFKSQPRRPHPLFASFVHAAKAHNQQNKTVDAA
ncbi:MAG: CTP synthetase [Magnetococcales bacterium]|nr:CTP synthetase [Magnetococcales bacterium]|tara:strand:+ start:60395 stop:62074 length:1680 start_codon:yes stop_codon:yes gene_type:complete